MFVDVSFECLMNRGCKNSLIGNLLAFYSKIINNSFLSNSANIQNALPKHFFSICFHSGSYSADKNPIDLHIVPSARFFVKKIAIQPIYRSFRSGQYTVVLLVTMETFDSGPQYDRSSISTPALAIISLLKRLQTHYLDCKVTMCTKPIRTATYTYIYFSPLQFVAFSIRKHCV